MRRSVFPVSFAALLIAVTVGCQPDSKSEPKGSDVGTVDDEANSVPVPSSEESLDAIVSLIKAGAIDSAAAKLRQLLIQNPNDLQANTLMLQVMLQRKDTEGAVSTLDRLAELNPRRQDDMQAHAASLLLNNGQVADSLARLRKILKRSPRFDDARRLYAQALTQRGNMFDANEQIRYLMGRQSMQQDELMSLLYPDRYFLDVPTLESKSPEELARIGVMNLARTYRVSGDPRKAVSLLEQAFANDESPEPAAMALYGRALASAQDFGRLQDWAAKTPNACKRYLDYWIACGELAMHLGRDESVSCFLEAVRREPSSIQAHYGLIAALEKQGKKDLAEVFRARNSQLDKLIRNARTLREASQPAPEMLVNISRQLSEIGRPLEALAWQELGLRYFQPSSQQLGMMPDYKRRVLSESPKGQDQETIFCGIKPESFDSAIAWVDSLESNGKGTTDTSVAQLKAAPPSTPVFRNVAKDLGVSFRYQNAAEPVPKAFRLFEAFGGGAACLDYDLDGWVDLYLGQAATNPPVGVSKQPNALFRQRDGRFWNAVEPSAADDRGYTVGVTSGDWNQDGFPDLLIGNLGTNRLLINQGDGSFREYEGLPSEAEVLTSSLAIADVTGDALPDMLEINYVEDPTVFDPIRFDEKGEPDLPAVLQFQPGQDRVLVTQPDGSLVQRPLGGQTGNQLCTGLALIVTDLDGVQGNEVFVANDLTSNQLWKRSGSGKWADTALTSGVAYGAIGKPMACMGVAAADFDGNGLLDIHISNFENEWSNQYMQKSAGLFVDSTSAFGLDTISQPMLGFGTQAIDYDNNSVWDLIIGNGHIEDYSAKGQQFQMPTQVLAGLGNRFVQQDVRGDDEYWSSKHLSRAAAKCDFNRDGKIDVLITDLQQDAVLLENQTENNHHWIQLQMVGTRVERDAIGSRVTVSVGERMLMQVSQTGDGFMAKNESVLFFGLGSATRIPKLTVRWPNGTEQVFSDVEADRRYLATQGEEALWVVQ